MINLKCKLVKSAREWIGTPFHLHGRIKHKGCDCIGLIIAIAKKLNLYSKSGDQLSNHDFFDYTLEDGQILKSFLNKHLYKKDYYDIGDVLLLQSTQTIYHCGIVGNYKIISNKSLIHSCIIREKVIEHRILNPLEKKILGIYSFFI